MIRFEHASKDSEEAYLEENLNLSRKMNTMTTMAVLTAPNVSTVEVSIVIVGRLIHSIESAWLQETNGKRWC